MYRDSFEILSAEVFKAIVEHSSDAVLLFTSADQLFYANEQAKAILNLHVAHLNAHASELLPGLLFEQLQQSESIEHSKLEFPCEEIEACDVGYEWLESKVSQFRIDDTNFRQLTLKDVTNTKRKESVLIHQATTDDLSGLSNRRRFRKVLDDHSDDSIVLAIVDVDYFKLINDKFGHVTGDCAIRFVATKLLDFFAEDSLCVSRLGGEEFAVVLRSDDRREVVSHFDAFRVAIQDEPFSEEQHPITVSIGLAFTSPDQDASNLLQNADKALYLSKDAGRNRLTVFD